MIAMMGAVMETEIVWTAGTVSMVAGVIAMAMIDILLVVVVTVIQVIGMEDLIATLQMDMARREPMIEMLDQGVVLVETGMAVADQYAMRVVTGTDLAHMTVPAEVAAHLPMIVIRDYCQSLWFLQNLKNVFVPLLEGPCL